ncbi:MAG TPA: cytochrome C oxidase subunit IV family protein [Steroidobacteraceae bacterium]
MNPMPLRAYVWSWLALLALLTATLGSAYIHLGYFNMIVNLVIAIMKALLVMVVFMHLKKSAPFVRLVAAAGFCWLAILGALSLADVLTQP